MTYRLEESNHSIRHILYFAVSLKNTGTELWRTDGTTVGTYMVKDIIVIQVEPHN
jgi:ELWxxDGT repeat protein